MKKVMILLSVLAIVGIANANLLTNAGFESGTTGWTLVGGPTSVVTTQAHSGTSSLGITGGTNGWWACPHAWQSSTASAGNEFNMNGYMLQTVAATGNTWGTLKMEFKDSAGLNLTPENVTKGAIDGLGQTYVGVIGLPQLGSSGAVNTWVFSELQASAPAGTASVFFYVMTVDGGTAGDTMYFDDIDATMIPEPATMALLGLGGLLLRRRK